MGLIRRPGRSRCVQRPAHARATGGSAVALQSSTCWAGSSSSIQPSDKARVIDSALPQKARTASNASRCSANWAAPEFECDSVPVLQKLRTAIRARIARFGRAARRSAQGCDGLRDRVARTSRSLLGQHRHRWSVNLRSVLNDGRGSGLGTRPSGPDHLAVLVEPAQSSDNALRIAW